MCSFGIAPRRSARPACRWLGLGSADLLRLLRGKSTRAVQRCHEHSQGSDKVAYFEGTDPHSIVLVGVLALAASANRLGEDIYGGVWAAGPWQCILALLFVISGGMMVSKTLRIPKSSKNRNNNFMASLYENVSMAVFATCKTSHSACRMQNTRNSHRGSWSACCSRAA